MALLSILSKVFGTGGLLAAALLGGCAITTTADEQASTEVPSAEVPEKRLASVPRNLLTHRTVAVRTGSTPSFYADTPGRRNFGILGVIAMMREGNRLVEDYRLEDPAGELSEELVATLATRNSMRTSTRDQADLLLDIKTINWDFRAYRNDPNHLFVVYAARVSLVNQRDGTVLASGKCRSRRDSEGDSATLEQLLANGAKRLHDELHEAAQECAQRVKDGTLSAFLQNLPPVAQGADAPQRTAPLR
ncbi:MAG: hypothetical protein H0T52_02005 [Lautropia sp.]|nr:hypothetical protein [Lautropia sp.]